MDWTGGRLLTAVGRCLFIPSRAVAAGQFRLTTDDQLPESTNRLFGALAPRRALPN